ncbi:hypothetical protein CcaverHIS002_0111320 [Cutaneotrichosporon cavernicola]|uniref:asparagine--tRNA ligase n=1 Tax=Cutaneotrichosporon cavernicola TaxID=279322 RepID=A0AA48L2B2_9TREE|nr:uncharacterized protein CcaverHIS019_0111210 [Cutaneotrichosporon cavernicola]BEI80603.1 hypothetical protein CcaverHIS002_0111320 [Cutaneotrichosporon cavernicola]BEI88403.1 hypothetical protein CcaverHIS019_0111210 [Cutaneotrichosporon cavernicola]BEI96176.1 hypothetical protein CcaverHIS631_0111250 [Cutaneotrichosporon cavernicola]BEJ03947.1 hypothetical protein CcaverHIS641_0111220 [Cutaneotrichosporon cavernicola]
MRVSRRAMSGLAPTVRGLVEVASNPTSPSPASPASSTASGWIRSLRAHKKVAFAELDDGSGGTLQAVLKGAARPIADSLSPGASVCFSGPLSPSKGSGQAVELLVEEASVLGGVEEGYPIQKKALPASVLRENAHLRFRTGAMGATMRVRDALARDWHDWFENNDFIHVHTPILTANDCEGAGEVFTLSQSLPAVTKEPFFPRPVNLTVSGQLHLEAPTHALGRTYTLSPAFRAEPSQTSRHLAEFYMLEAEVAFVDNLSSLLDIAEAGVRDTVSSLLHSDSGRARRAREDIARIAASQVASEAEERASAGLPPLPPACREPTPLAHLEAATGRFERVTYAEAVILLEKQHAEVPFERTPGYEEGLASEHERWLCEHFGKPVFVTHYPAEQKPFYMLPSDANASAPTSSGTVACFDLLFPGIGEMAGGSMREHRLEALKDSLARHGLPEAEYQWYLDLRRFGSVPHGGWGMGWERWVCWVTGQANVRDVVAFPRWAGSCRF